MPNKDVFPIDTVATSGFECFFFHFQLYLSHFHLFVYILYKNRNSSINFSLLFDCGSSVEMLTFSSSFCKFQISIIFFQCISLGLVVHFSTMSLFSLLDSF